ncbi:MAG: NAD(P)/FAD-dependent oxidoreductase, partial [Cyclobacteriaceae bacterium]|nr:NAD(P)/FAD-dependent oxidoreductase [Cyclobacteriaceae bacterium]
MEKYDLIVIGAGPSGYAAAMRSVDFKKKTLLIERKEIGGAGVTNGALSSKTWWEIARQIRQMNNSLEHYHIERPKLNFQEIRQMVMESVSGKRQLLHEHMDHLSETNGQYLSYRVGDAQLLDKNKVEIQNGVGNVVVYGDYIILATGSRPRKLPEIPIDDKTILTSDSIESMDDFPKSMVIIGAGVIGCEYATIFSGFGLTKVHLIDKGDHILPFEDSDVVHVIESNMEKNGVLVHRNSQLKRIEIINGEVEYELVYDDGRTETFHVEKALVAVGRVPNYEKLWKSDLPIELTPRGIKDMETQTSVSNIYAVGDITCDIALVNVGELEGRYAVERMFGKPKRRLVYENISTIMFLHPEVAG